MSDNREGNTRRSSLRHRHHVGSGSRLSLCRNTEPSWTAAAASWQSAFSSPVFIFNIPITCGTPLPLIEVGACLRISSSRSFSHDFSHAEILGPGPAEDRGHPQRRRREGQGLRRRGRRGAPRGGRGGRRQGGLERDQAHAHGRGVASGPQGPRGVFVCVAVVSSKLIGVKPNIVFQHRRCLRCVTSQVSTSRNFYSTGFLHLCLQLEVSLAC